MNARITQNQAMISLFTLDAHRHFLVPSLLVRLSFLFRGVSFHDSPYHRCRGRISRSEPSCIARYRNVSNSLFQRILLGWSRRSHTPAGAPQYSHSRPHRAHPPTCRLSRAYRYIVSRNAAPDSGCRRNSPRLSPITKYWSFGTTKGMSLEWRQQFRMIGKFCRTGGVILLQLLTVDPHASTVDIDCFARQADYPLDQIRLAVCVGRPENDDLLAVRIPPKGHMQIRERHAGIVAQPAHDQVIANQQRSFHRSGGNHTRLSDSVPLINRNTRTTQAQAITSFLTQCAQRRAGFTGEVLFLASLPELFLAFTFHRHFFASILPSRSRGPPIAPDPWDKSPV